MSPKVLLSFDVEEFDMPLEYQFAISPSQQMQIGKEGLDTIIPLLEAQNIPTTLFTTANFAQHFPDAIRWLANQHEIASHTLFHSAFENEHLLQSKQILESISQQTVKGLRMPRMRKVEMQAVKDAGYQYDSSVNPTWIPGRYNNLHLPRTIYTEQGVTRIPASVSANLRIPLFWLSFKNLPYALFKKLTIQALKKDGYVCLYFHPWEFININDYGLPGFTKRLCGAPLLNRLNQLINDLKKSGYAFSTIADFLEERNS